MTEYNPNHFSDGEDYHCRQLLSELIRAENGCGVILLNLQVTILRSDSFPKYSLPPLRYECLN